MRGTRTVSPVKPTSLARKEKVGTHLFWAPEMCGEEKSVGDAAADVWALGVTHWMWSQLFV